MRPLLFCAGLHTLWCGTLYFYNEGFAFGSPVQDRPLLSMLLLFAMGFVIYFVSLKVALKSPAAPRLPVIVLGASALFRVILLPTNPILEIDIYRYLWDGAALNQGVNPYRYSPEQVIQAVAGQDMPADLRTLVTLRDTSPSLNEILKRIHYQEIATVYPPISQLVFAVADRCAPDTTTVSMRVLILKCILVFFDLGTCVMVLFLLNLVGTHPGWAISYAWCPLVLKEFANTGHLDSIAVFFATAGVWFVARAIRFELGSNLTVSVASLVMALSIGSKLYAVVLVPVCAAILLSKKNWRVSLYFVFISLGIGGVFVAPQIATHPYVTRAHFSAELAHDGAIQAEESVTNSGLTTFLTQWEMNDFLFMVFRENLRPVVVAEERPSIWFAIVPNSWRASLSNCLSELCGGDVKATSFLTARALTLLIYSIILLMLVKRVYAEASLEYYLQAVFLTLAWFWLLSPTQNPWYWSWALPFVPFARHRVWMAVSPIAFLYYCRFWFSDQFAEQRILETSYEGAEFYDYVVIWLIYLPWLSWLAFSQQKAKEQ